MHPGDLPYAEAAVLCIFDDVRFAEEDGIPLWFSLLACSFERWDLTAAEAETALEALREKGLVESLGNLDLEPRADFRLFKLTKTGAAAARYLLPPSALEVAKQYATDEEVAELRSEIDGHLSNADFELASRAQERLETRLIQLATKQGHPVPGFERFYSRR